MLYQKTGSDGRRLKVGRSAEIGGAMVGGVSLLAVFAVLCLAIFALLTLLRAESDLGLSQKTAEMTEAYYQADSQAEKRVAALIPIFQQSLSKTKKERDADFADGAALQGGDFNRQSEEITFHIPVSSGLSLTVIVKPLDQKPYYEIVTWKEENLSKYTPSQSIPVWNGGDQP